jgi:hypothetical protein
MLVEAYLTTVLVVLARDSDRLLVDFVVKVEQILVHSVQEMLQASGLRCVLVVNCLKRAHLLFDARIAKCLGWPDRVAGAHAVVFGWLWQVKLLLIGKLFC